MIREALLYEKTDGSGVRCGLCAHRCNITPNRRGLCGVRENRDGVLYSLVFGTMIAEHVDPIEKKPFFHVYPGSRSYSVATVGCNFSCSFCQNHEISQMPRSTLMIMGEEVPPEMIVRRAKEMKCQTVAYTYTEPTVYLETALEIMKIAATEGLKNLFVTNGYMTTEALELVSPYLAAANVDLKSFREAFYKKQCGARLSPVLDSLKKMKDLGIWVEVTTLLIPGLNDSARELKDIASFIRTLGAETPWHISRFHPQFRMIQTPPTPVSSLRLAGAIGKEAGLLHVYTGNVPGDEGENTFCSNCNKLLIRRYGFRILDDFLSEQRCPSCGRKLEGLF
ncbi:MAG TPA: AmmeMemoRadiSam system radical SAM enzyme [Smithellaceae bacterium]|nr:AmmeMemoRadiSam system radical SAM enzyme [Smithellaceae bacterium]HRS83317.1 AmmeMemoRadiSam system radical SAM enzyme [Smithellaceae bacterium]HRV45733.1 AmmeMemoRadiSam system radical SAM enzyme [Smithellaceae bacterium]